MARDVPQPVSAALSVLQAGFQKARKVPETVVKVPMNAVGYALSAAAKAKQAQHEVLAKVGLRSSDQPAPTAPGRADGSTPAPSKPKASTSRQEKPAEEKPKASKTPKTPPARPAKVDTAASASDADRADQIAERVSTGSASESSELPLPDFDHMTLGQLRGRLRKLGVEDLVTLRDYEKGHADRLPIVTMLDNRIAKISAETESERALPSASSDGSGPSGS